MRHPEGCLVPNATRFIKSVEEGNKFVYYNLDAETPIPESGKRPPQCEKCTKCMPKVERGNSYGLSTFEITPEQ
jgi:hypothetical protein